MIFLRLSLESLISLWKNNDFLNVIFEIFDFHMKKPTIFLTLSLKSLISLWKFNVFLKIIVQIFDLPLKNHSFCKDCRANLWFSFEKHIDFSPGCVIQTCISDKLQSLPNDPWTHLAPKVHLRVKVLYWKCHFLSALHFPEIRGSRFETSGSK